MKKNKLIYDALHQKNNELKSRNKKLRPDEYNSYLTAYKNYYLLKKFNFLLLSGNSNLTDPNREKKYNKVLAQYCNFYDLYEMIVAVDPQLKKVIEIKDELYIFYSDCKYENAKKELETLIVTCRTSNIQAMQNFSKTMVNWKQEIINSFIIIPAINKKMNNGLIENRNKTIKLLKHSSNGYTNWSRFRNRVLYVLNDDVPMKL